LRLVVVTPHFWSDVGVGNAVRELTNELVKLGVDLAGLIHADPYVSNTYPSTPIISVETKENFFTGPYRELLISRRAAHSLKLLVKSNHGDDCVVHSHSLYPSALIGKGCKEMDAAFITTVHGINAGEIERFRKEMPVHPQELRYRLIHYMVFSERRALIRRSRGHFIAQSHENASVFMRMGLSRSRVHVIPNGVNLNSYKPYDSYEARKKLKLPTEKPLVLTICAIEPRKGVHTLIRAARTIVDEEPEAYFVIVGGVKKAHRWYLAHLKQLISRFHLKKHFMFAGFVPKEDLPFYINSADVFALASSAEGGTPLVVSQAMACKRIVIATQNAAAGYLPPSLIVQNGNSEDLAQKISFYLSNTKDRKLVGEELYEKAVNELSWANIAEKTLDLYRKAMGDCSA